MNKIIYCAIITLSMLCLLLNANETGQSSPAISWKFDFGAAAIEKGYIGVDNQSEYTDEQGYGWIVKPESTVNRAEPNALLQDFVFSKESASFRMKISPAIYRLTLTLGDMLSDDHILQARLSENDIEVPLMRAKKQEFATAALFFESKTGFLEVNLESPTKDWALNALTLEPVETIEETKITREQFQFREEQPQQVCMPETDTTSPRHTKLTSLAPSDDIVRADIDNDGDPDILELWFNNRRVRWLDENDDMKPTDVMGDMINDSMQIDRDGDGFYDGPGDMSIKWVDENNDGKADLQIFAINPDKTQKRIWGGASHYMAFEDVDHDRVLAAMDWETFFFEGWKITGTGNFCPDYNGNSIFLKVHLPPFVLNDPRLNWENPFAFYDFDNDGTTEMAIRVIDSPKSDDAQHYTLDGIAEEIFVTFDLDNDTNYRNEMDYDLTLHFLGGEKLDYTKFKHSFPHLKAPDWILPYYRYTNWREIDELIYLPHNEAYEQIFKPAWNEAWLTFDEDDDDHRWERVECYYPEDPYVTGKWKKDKPRGMAGHPQSDTLGDRGEFDRDFSGKGSLYIGSWDQKIHLHGAEWGAWLVDRHREYWGSHPVTGDSSPIRAEKVGEVVHYKDTDNNGFIDTISFDYDGDEKMESTVALLDFATTENPHPDEQPLIIPDDKKWEGMKDMFTRISEKAWQDAWMLYHTIWKKGWSNNELDDLAIASSTGEKYNNAYWLKETIIRRLIRVLQETDSETLRDKIIRPYYLGEMDVLIRNIEDMDSEKIRITLQKIDRDIFGKEYITAIMKKVFRYQIEHPLDVVSNFWQRGALYTGIMGAYNVTGDKEYLGQALKWGEENKWDFNPEFGGFSFADNNVALQTYADLYLVVGGEEKIAAIRKAMDELIANPPRGRELWWWCDSLYMAPPLYAKMYKITGNNEYIKVMNEMWWDTKDFLYSKEDHLFFRDKNYFEAKSKNGKRVFWSRGNGWVIAGIAHVLDYLPADDPYRNDFIKVFKEMAEAVAALQGADGLWRTSLLDPEELPTPETSGTGFYCHALAWGINNKILERDKYEPVVKKAWDGLNRCVFPNGKLGWVQVPAVSPEHVYHDTMHEYATGAFLLAGSEILKMYP